jgi:thiosulfate/3-mercaptopyruvate sulfurtransferase
MSEARSRTLISVAGLADLLAAGGPVVLLDVLDEKGAAPTDRPRIPGALSVHLATDFSGKPTKTSGKRPLPEIMDLQADARRWGINPGSTVVVYDNTGGAQSFAWSGSLTDGTYAVYLLADTGDLAVDNGQWASFSVVPAPGAVALVGMAGLVGRRRRRA